MPHEPKDKSREHITRDCPSPEESITDADGRAAGKPAMPGDGDFQNKLRRIVQPPRAWWQRRHVHVFAAMAAVMLLCIGIDAAWIRQSNTLDSVILGGLLLVGLFAVLDVAILVLIGTVMYFAAPEGSRTVRENVFIYWSLMALLFVLAGAGLVSFSFSTCNAILRAW
jgi:hypothetical protein